MKERVYLNLGRYLTSIPSIAHRPSPSTRLQPNHPSHPTSIVGRFDAPSTALSFPSGAPPSTLRHTLPTYLTLRVGPHASGWRALQTTARTLAIP